jgi:hypothetical protein
MMGRKKQKGVAYEGYMFYRNRSNKALEKFLQGEETLEELRRASEAALAAQRGEL